MNTGVNEEIIILPSRTYNPKKKKEVEEPDDDIAENVMNNLSQFVNRKRG